MSDVRIVPAQLIQPVGLDGETPAYQSTVTNVPARTTVTTTVVVVLLTEDEARKQFIIQNTDVLPIHIAFGANDPSVNDHHITLKACDVIDDGTGGSFISDMWKGEVRAIAGPVLLTTTGAVTVTEFT